MTRLELEGVVVSVTLPELPGLELVVPGVVQRVIVASNREDERGPDAGGQHQDDEERRTKAARGRSEHPLDVSGVAPVHQGDATGDRVGLGQ